MFPKSISRFGMEKQNLMQQNHAFTNQNKCTKTQNKHKQVKQGLVVASYDLVWKQRGPILASVLHKSVTYLLRHVQPQTDTGPHSFFLTANFN